MLQKKIWKIKVLPNDLEEKYEELQIDENDEYFKRKREEFPPDFERKNNEIITTGSKYNVANPFV